MPGVFFWGGAVLVLAALFVWFDLLRVVWQLKKKGQCSWPTVIAICSLVLMLPAVLSADYLMENGDRKTGEMIQQVGIGLMFAARGFGAVGLWFDRRAGSRNK